MNAGKSSTVRRPPLSPSSLAALVEEVRFEFARAGGPGGQHVNKVSTQVTLCFDVCSSRILSQHQQRLICRRLKGRISKDGVLRVRSRKHRSQPANKRAAIERFQELVLQALRPVKSRVRTVVPRSARERRLRQKSERSKIKQKRRRPDLGD